MLHHPQITTDCEQHWQRTKSSYRSHTHLLIRPWTMTTTTTTECDETSTSFPLLLPPPPPTTALAIRTNSILLSSSSCMEFFTHKSMQEDRKSVEEGCCHCHTHRRRRRYEIAHPRHRQTTATTTILLFFQFISWAADPSGCCMHPPYMTGIIIIATIIRQYGSMKEIEIAHHVRMTMKQATRRR